MPQRFHAKPYAKVSPEGRGLVRYFEGDKLSQYQDVAGLWTIGTGHLITPDETKSGMIKIGGVMVPYKNGITALQSDVLLAQDLGIKEQCQCYVSRMLVPQEIDALVSLVFNIGMGNFFESSLLKSINAGAPADEIGANWRKWNKARVNGELTVSRGLVKRREGELVVWNTGDYAKAMA